MSTWYGARVNALVLGAGGQLGSELVRLLGEGAGVSHRELSVTDLVSLHGLIDDRRPSIVFNCAAYNAVDRAETEPALARLVNSEGALNAAVACKRLGVRLVHFSTNFVFDGRLDRPYVESDQPAPLGAYAKSKLEGERAVLSALPQALVVRTAALFGSQGSAIRGGSFPERILKRAQLGERLRVVADQRVNPTYAFDLAAAAMRLAESDLDGVVHVVAAGCCGWDDFARAILDESGVAGEVESVSSADLAAPALRPLNGCLVSSRVAALRPWREGLREWVERRAEPHRVDP